MPDAGETPSPALAAGPEPMAGRLRGGALAPLLERLWTPVGLTTLSGVAGRVLIALVQLYLMRLLLASLGADRYAGFVLLSSLLVWFTMSDLGLGASVQNHYSEARARGRDPAAHVACGLAFGMVAFAVVAGGVWLAAPHVAPRFLAGVATLAPAEKVRAFTLAGLLLAAFGVANIGYKVWYAQGRGYWANLLPVAGNLASLAAVLLVLKSGAGHRLSLCLLAVLGPVALAAFAAFLRQGLAHPPRLVPSVAGPVASRAAHFWLFGILASVTLHLDYIVMSQRAGANDIILYNLHQKVFALVQYPHIALMAAAWPVFTEHITRGEWTEVRAMTRRILTASLTFVALATAAVAVLLPHVLGFLDPKGQVRPEVAFTFLFGAYSMVMIWVATYSTVLQSMSDMRMFILGTPLQAAVSLSLLFYLTPRYGCWGVVTAMAVSYLALPVWVMPLRIRWLAARAARAGAPGAAP